MKLFRDPLLHFVLAGAVLFAGYTLINRHETDTSATDPVHIGGGDVRWLKETFANQWQRTPTDDELRGLVAGFLEEELFAREAKSLGFDQNDTIVRRRLAQKLAFLVDDTSRIVDPTDEELRRFYEANAERFRVAAHISFAQVFFNPGRRPHERWDKGNLDLSELKKPEMLEFEYARSALKLGLKLESQLGVNPYKFGMVGSTDAHTGLTAVEENNFFGKTTSSEPSPDRANHPFVKTDKAVIMGWEQTASGYAAVWAPENTREAIFDAMERRETYATTGPRMTVRFFGGYDFEAADANTRSPAVVGYTKGVPMGADLGAAPEGKAPTFLVAALKDPIGANLDRYQIVKGWLDAKGEMQEKVYDVAWSGDRKPAADGKVPAVGSTVDVANATWTNTIGAPELISVWKDPDFDPAQRAFYYGRVIEIPTPRWTAYDAKYFGIKMAPEVPMQMQERAYTSPIWYTPPK
jgi:hypothetical protein